MKNLVSNNEMNNKSPSRHEFELTLFGNGYGECVLLHVCDNKWIIIDSCINPWTKKIAPIEYLESVGVDASKQVKLLVISHWHDDHIEGFSRIYQLCINAKLALSQAMHQREFFRFINVVHQRPIYSYAGKSTDEIKQILDTMLNRKEISGEYKCKWVSNDSILYNEKIETKGSDAKIVALSPLDHSITTALVEISNLIPKANTQIRVNSSINPNHFAIVLWISIGDIHILLGSDLEERAHPKGAWSVIANNGTRPNDMADIFKVPHHGSQNAYCNLVYEKMLTDNHLSLLTPFTHGKVALPNHSDIKRLKEKKCSGLYLACRVSSKKNRHDAVVEKILKESTKSRETLNSFGYITLRKNVLDGKDDWQIITYGNATKL
ncbi:MAG: hypothetical protein HQK79_19790 [Desulfobacterales bacterium]|nr:hypothetical protein [Desulfobacterales bacterium]MBF0398323.1 hypothetical protein [Desulfobacterales bacterium]